jgi:hypothetical protein
MAAEQVLAAALAAGLFPLLERLGHAVATEQALSVALAAGLLAPLERFGRAMLAELCWCRRAPGFSPRVKVGSPPPSSDGAPLSLPFDLLFEPPTRRRQSISKPMIEPARATDR